MSTPPLSGQDLRAAAEAHQELGPDYSDAVLDAFLEKAEARLDQRRRAPARSRVPSKAVPDSRRGLLIGLAPGGVSTWVLLSLWTIVANLRGPDPAAFHDAHMGVLVILAGFTGYCVMALRRRRRDHR